MSLTHSSAAGSPAADAAMDPIPTAPGQPPLVLVIEDDALTGDLLHDALRSQGYEVVVVRRRSRALSYLRQHTPCLILLDVGRPIDAGAAFAFAYRAEPPPHAPIVIVSAEDDVRGHCRTLPIGGYLDKPFDLDALFALVGRYCSPALAAPTP
jgi:DNA-binding response OmpR family regulator